MDQEQLSFFKKQAFRRGRGQRLLQVIYSEKDVVRQFVKSAGDTSPGLTHFQKYELAKEAGFGDWVSDRWNDVKSVGKSVGNAVAGGAKAIGSGVGKAWDYVKENPWSTAGTVAGLALAPFTGGSSLLLSAGGGLLGSGIDAMTQGGGQQQMTPEQQQQMQQQQRDQGQRYNPQQGGYAGQGQAGQGQPMNQQQAYIQQMMNPMGGFQQWQGSGGGHGRLGNFQGRGGQGSNNGGGWRQQAQNAGWSNQQNHGSATQAVFNRGNMAGKGNNTFASNKNWNQAGYTGRRDPLGLTDHNFGNRQA